MNTVGVYQKYPNTNALRFAEGGVRVQKEQLKRKISDSPLVTIITVCFNSVKTLEQAILSVINQSYDNIEYIIVDGASSDGSIDLIKKYENKVDYFISESDQGIYFAMNKGLSLSQGEYIIFLNSDDWYTPRCIEKLVRAQQESGADFVSAMANYVDEEGNFLRVQPSSPFDASVNFRMPLRHETMLISAEMYNQEGGYDTSYKIIADRVKTAHLFWHGYTHFELKDPLLNFRVSGVSSTRINELYIERKRALLHHFPSMAADDISDLMSLEKLAPIKLFDITNRYKSAEFRASAIAYAKSLINQRHKSWIDLPINLKEKFLDDRTFLSDLKHNIPKISIILPVYNGQATLAKCFDSILCQYFKEYEIICINDQSPDDSQFIIDQYVQRDSRIRSFINNKNLGLGATRNKGIALSCGDYIFHIDPDDTIPQDALNTLYKYAVKYDSDMTKGGFRHEQLLFAQKSKVTIKQIVTSGENHLVNRTLRNFPEILRTTEGHWSYLYKKDFAQRVFYPEDLKMGQDSIFLVNALVRARSISVIDSIVYNYTANSESAMNTYTYQKFMDEIEWRRRAWHVLNDVGKVILGNYLMFNYWSLSFFDALRNTLSEEKVSSFFIKLHNSFSETGGFSSRKVNKPELLAQFEQGFDIWTSNYDQKNIEVNKKKMRVEIFTTFVKGGAGIAAKRYMDALRIIGHDARIRCLFKKDSDSHCHLSPLNKEAKAVYIENNKLFYEEWRKKAVVTSKTAPEIKARELFSKNECVADLKSLSEAFDKADVIHLHWVVGMIDYAILPKLLKNKLVVWTLHDMNPFTGGCHYSEGCEQYKNQCQECPLLGKSNLAHEMWKEKRDSYSRINNLKIIAPSKWLADCARQSSLLKDKSIYVVPNIIPRYDFTLTNNLVARAKLGLPLDKKIIIFGADSLDNSRKGGDILIKSLEVLENYIQVKDIHVLLFGAAKLNIKNVTTHSMGYIKDSKYLSLIYSAADVFAFPSREDNAPQTVVESLLSGTPIVAFPVGNVPDMIDHLNTGFLAKYEDYNNFAEGLAWALKSCKGYTAIKRSIHSHIKTYDYCDPDDIINNHLSVYNSSAS